MDFYKSVSKVCHCVSLQMPCFFVSKAEKTFGSALFQIVFSLDWFKDT